jgi:hypothetical protein
VNKTLSVVTLVLLCVAAVAWLTPAKKADALPTTVYIKEYFDNEELDGLPVGIVLRDCLGQWHSSGNCSTPYYRVSYEDCDYWPPPTPTPGPITYLPH